MASIRPFYSDKLERYPFNCFLPIPYPIVSVGELQSLLLHILAHSFATARNSLSPEHPLSLYKTLVSASKDKSILGLLPFNPDAHDVQHVDCLYRRYRLDRRRREDYHLLL
jgi:hypothetical protein